MPKTAAIALAALIIASAAALAGIIAASANGGPQLDSNGRRLDCIPVSVANPSGPCLWTPTLTKAEVKVEFEYPYCVVKLDVETNLDELPSGAAVSNNKVALVHIMADGKPRFLGGSNLRDRDSVYRPSSLNYRGYDRHARWGGIQGYSLAYFQRNYSNRSAMLAHYPDWNLNHYYNGVRQFRYTHGETDWFKTLTQTTLDFFPQTTQGTVEFVVDLEYSGEFVKPKPTGNGRTALENVSPQATRSNAIPLSHTFAGLVDEMFTCMDVSEREEERAAERVALESQKAGLRQSLTLLRSELSRARQHELDATGILKEVIDVSEKVEEMLRTIQRVRVEGLAERRRIVERYYSEESQRYSVFIQSLEGSQAALAAADAAIAAHKAELERSRAELERIVKEAQAAEAELIAEIEEAEKALGNDEE